MSQEKNIFWSTLTVKSSGGKIFEFLHCPFELPAKMHCHFGQFGWILWCLSAWPLKGQCTIPKFLSPPIFLSLESNIFSLLLTSFPTLGTGFQLCLREFFHAAQSSFPCGSEHFSLRVRALSMRVRALSMRLRNQASKTKCQHSSSLMSSIKKRIL